LDSFKDESNKEEFRAKLVKEAPADRPIINITPTVYDFGDVSQRQGVATTFFELSNEGKTDLIIDRVETSCGCTSAKVEKEVISPGGTTTLKVYYDPSVHPDFRGAAIREIYVYSNDPIDSQKKVSIELNQVD
jgi:hypothetical protein